MSKDEIHSLTPDLPEYHSTRHFLRILDRVPYTLYRSMYNSIWEQRGNPKKTVEWIDPETWIPERLRDEEAILAQRMWQESHQELNPRYTRGHWYLATKHRLIERDESDLLCITDRGQAFLEQESGEVTSKIDSHEGILIILRLVAERGPGRRSEFLPDFTIFC